MSNPTELTGERQPGRSFEDASQPLGETTAHTDGATNLPDRANVVAVLRKAEEFMRHANPPATGAGLRRAIELAAGRMGVLVEDYDRMVKADPELQALERQVITANAI